MSRVFRHTLYVPYADIDKMGFVYYANYFVYFEMARASLLREVGLPYGEMEARGVLLPVVTAHCDYRRPAHYDDLLLVLSRCTEWRGARLHIEYELHRIQKESDAEGEALCKGFSEHVCMSPEGKVIKPVSELRSLVE